MKIVKVKPHYRRIGKTRKKAYGIRSCVECKGICHEGSWRASLGIRRRYFCSDFCLKRNIEKRYLNAISRKYRPSQEELKNAVNEMFQEYTKNNLFYEKVDVKTR